ncbi:MAG: Na+/H+ antiporter subunit E [Mycobacteriaceae bacterium]|nr:Na+/H+ antiporter subunit E [Mycobacteriaceae bacterium]
MNTLTVRRWALRIWVLCWLMLVWVLLWGNASAANILSGLLISLLITVLLPLPVVPVEGRLHPLSLAKLMAVVGWFLVQSSLQVAWLAIKPGPPPMSAVLRATVAVKSDLVLALAVNAINLTPGTLVLEIDRDQRHLFIHVLNVGSAHAVDRFHREVELLERLLIAAFEREKDWKSAAQEHP